MRLWIEGHLSLVHTFFRCRIPGVNVRLSIFTYKQWCVALTLFHFRASGTCVPIWDIPAASVTHISIIVILPGVGESWFVCVIRKGNTDAQRLSYSASFTDVSNIRQPSVIFSMVMEVKSFHHVLKTDYYRSNFFPRSFDYKPGISVFHIKQFPHLHLSSF